MYTKPLRWPFWESWDSFLSLAAASNNTYWIHCSIDSVALAAFYAYPKTMTNISSDLETVDGSWITWVNCSFRMKAISPKLGSDTWHNIIYTSQNNFKSSSTNQNWQKLQHAPFYHVGITSACYVYQKIVILMIPNASFEIFNDSTHEFWRIITWWKRCHLCTLLLLDYLKIFAKKIT